MSLVLLLLLLLSILLFSLLVLVLLLEGVVIVMSKCYHFSTCHDVFILKNVYACVSGNVQRITIVCYSLDRMHIAFLWNSESHYDFCKCIYGQTYDQKDDPLWPKNKIKTIPFESNYSFILIKLSSM